MQHTIKPEYTNEDGELIPAVIIEAPNLIWLQVANPEWEEEAAPEEERTFTPDERIMESDVPYVPLARAESAEVDLARIGAMLEPHAPPSAEAIIEAVKAMSREIDELEGQGWRPVDDLDLEQDIEAEIMMRATYQHEYGAWDARSINILKSDVDFWRPAPPQ